MWNMKRVMSWNLLWSSMSVFTIFFFYFLCFHFISFYFGGILSIQCPYNIRNICGLRRPWTLQIIYKDFLSYLVKSFFSLFLFAYPFRFHSLSVCFSSFFLLLLLLIFSFYFIFIFRRRLLEVGLCWLDTTRVQFSFRSNNMLILCNIHLRIRFLLNSEIFMRQKQCR